MMSKKENKDFVELSYNLNDDDVKVFTKIKAYKLFILTDIKAQYENLKVGVENNKKWVEFYNEMLLLSTKKDCKPCIKELENVFTAQLDSSTNAYDKLSKQLSDVKEHYERFEKWYNETFENLPIVDGKVCVNETILNYCRVESLTIPDNWEEKIQG